MAGKPDKGWGGARENSGRPKETLSQAQVKEMMNKAKEFANKNKGRTPDDYLLMIIHADDKSREVLGEEKIGIKDRLAAIKLWKDKTMIAIKEGSEADQNLAPMTYLPEERHDNVVDING